MSPLILIVEDDLETLNLFTTIIQREDYRVIGVSGGQQALETLQEEAPDLILLDLGLPGISGLDVLRYIRAAPRLGHVQVLVITAYPKLAREADRQGADQIIIKPVRVSELLHVIHYLLPG